QASTVSLEGMTSSSPVVQHDRRAVTSAPIHDLHAERWSPRAFDDTAVLSDETLATVLEAARWSPSASNSQPWRFIVGRRGTATHAAIVGGLIESNAAWAASASALIVNVAVTHNDEGRPLRWAEYDLGQA